MKKPIVVDFETEGIKPRPEYPPKPVGVAIWDMQRAQSTARYHAWGHPTENNCTPEQGRARLEEVYKSGREVLFHYGKFDQDVAEVEMGLPVLPWERTHDTLYSLFLHNPHAISLGLKPSAAAILGMPPDEQDAVTQWLYDHGVIKSLTQKDRGAYIALAPGKLVGTYAIGDVVRTGLLHQKIYPTFDEGMRQSYDRERRLMPLLLRNEREGMRVDVDRLEKDIAVYEKALKKADDWLRKALHAPTMNLDSDEEVAAALDACDMITEWRLTPKRQEKSVSKKYLTPDKFKDKKVASVMGYRNRLTTVLSMSMRPWLEQATRCKGYITTEWNQVRNEHGNDGKKGTRTSRLSCSRFMNITKDFGDKDDGYIHPKFLGVPELPRVRCYILPDKGDVFVHRDFSQQELRVLAHFEDGPLCREYNENPSLDVHNYVAGLIKQIMGLDLERRVVKQLNFGKIYGMGVTGLMEKLHCTREQAEQFVKAHRAALPGVKKLEDQLKWRARQGQPVRTWGGSLIYCEEPKMIKGKWRTFEYKMLNYLIQRSSAEWTKEACIRYDAVRKNGRMLVTVHDELDLSIKIKALKSEMKLLKHAMEDQPLDVPMLSDGKTGPNWGEIKPYKDPSDD